MTEGTGNTSNLCRFEKSFKLFSENSNCTEGIYTQYDVSSRSCDCPAACEQVLVDSGYHWSSQNPLAKFWKLTLKIIDNKSIETFKQYALPHLINCHYQHISRLYIIQGGFFNWSALKMTKCQITCKSLQKSSKCQNFQRVWHLVIFRADQLKKPPGIRKGLLRG